MNLSDIGLQSNFTAIDWGIIAVYLLGSVAIGFYANRFVSNMADYVVAGRALRSCLAIATMVGSELGLVTVMYSAQKGFTGGFAAFHIGLVAGVITLLVGMTGFIVVPLRRMRVMTIPEFYEKRFGRGVRVLGGVVLALAGILNMGLFLKAGTAFVTGLTGMTSDVELKIVMSVLLGLVLIYTILGGMISVVITDYIQFVVLAFGLLAACVFAVRELGWDSIITTVQSLKGTAGFDPFHGDGFGAGYVVWMMFTAGLVSCAVWQTAVMRACAADSAKVVKRLYTWSSIGFLIRFMIPNFLGICALVYMSRRPELQAAFLPADGNASSEVTLAAMPIFLGQILPAGIIGIIGAGMLAAFMSTHDSYLLCWSSVLTEDVIAPCAGKRLSTRTRILLTRLFIAVIGAFLLVWSLWYPLEQDLWDYMAVTGAVYFTGAFALLLAGIYWKRASKTGAYLALIAGFTAVLGLAPVRKLLALDQLGSRLDIEFSGEVVGLSAATLCLVLMVLGSLLFPDQAATNRNKEY
ncbi:MAG: sodium:solute symporter family protein [Phycisphaerales bacterium]|nr:MAG: sodium:solute symporter family protein [Phycisphaerales bacterium]